MSFITQDALKNLVGTGVINEATLYPKSQGFTLSVRIGGEKREYRHEDSIDGSVHDFPCTYIYGGEEKTLAFSRRPTIPKVFKSSDTAINFIRSLMLGSCKISELQDLPNPRAKG